MASMIDVIMAQYDTDVSKEELKTQKKIENDSVIRAINDIGAMAETATMGYQIGTGIESVKTQFQMRSAGKAAYMSEYVKNNPGATMKDARKAWRQEGRSEFKDFRKGMSPLETETMGRDEVIATYLKGTNLATTVLEDGEVKIVDDKDNPSGWLNIGGCIRSILPESSGVPEQAKGGPEGPELDESGRPKIKLPQLDGETWYPGKYLGKFWNENS
jgi:hypothetical protein